MKKTGHLRRFVPGWWVTLRAWFAYRCLVSPRAEVEISPLLAIGRGTVISSFTKLKSSDGPLRIGRNVQISNGCVIGSHGGGIEIGDDCLISPNVSIIGSNYRYDRLDQPIRLQGLTSSGIRIGANVWIGAGCVVLDGAQIGSGTIVTPNSVVSGRLPENAIAQGNPARVVFQRR